MTSGIPLVFQPADFNGFQLSFLGAPAITEVHIGPDSSASFSTVAHSWTTTSIIFNLSGVVAQPQDQLVPDVAFATDPGGNPNNPAGGVPEPATWAMMTVGFAGLAFTALRRTKTARAVA